METGVGVKVSENLALVISPVGGACFLPEETGGGRNLPGGPRTPWSHPREGTRGRDRRLGAPQSPAAGSEFGQAADRRPASILWEEQGLQGWTLRLPPN